MKTITKIITGAAAVGVVAALALPRIFQPEPEPEIVALPAEKAETPKKDTITLTKELIGTVEAADTVYVIPKVAGEVVEIYVSAGDTVTEGQPLCRIDNKQIDSARISLDAARVSLETANANLSRMQVLYASGDISAQAFEQTQTAAESAQIQYDGAKLAYDLQVEYSTVTAPIAGKVESTNMELHNMVSQSAQVCVITGEGGKKVTFSVADGLRGNLEPGDAITLEKQGGVYQGTISQVASMVDVQTGLFPVEATIENGDALAPGVKIQISVVSDQAENVMTLPVDCIYYDGGEAYVYTYDKGIVHRVPVEVGIYDSQTAEIVSGLGAEDMVITTWTSELAEGASVELQAEEEETQAETAAAAGQDSSSEQ